MQYHYSSVGEIFYIPEPLINLPYESVVLRTRLNFLHICNKNCIKNGLKTY